jgi:serine/threonine protein kinase
MGKPTSQSNAQSLRDILVGLSRFEQQKVAIQWARDNHCVVDMFGAFAKERHLLLFQSGNESENWIDPANNLVYKMNTLMHVGGDLQKLFNRIEYYNHLFPHIALQFVGFHVMSEDNAYPIFIQPFVDNVRFATPSEILSYMKSRGFEPQEKDGVFCDGQYLLSDIKPKNVLASEDGLAIFVIDADVSLVQMDKLSKK